MEPDDEYDDLAEAWARFKHDFAEAVIYPWLIPLVYWIAGWRRG